MASRDVRDIMGLPLGGEQPKTVIAKRPKPAGGPRQKGINRELLALHGERAPPVSIIDSSKQYRAKIHRDFKPSHWEHTAFNNSARADGLRLRHWRKRKPFIPIGEDAENQDPDQKPHEQEYDFAKFNLDISVPTYTDEQYEAHLQSDQWTKEETDYLVTLVKEYYQRWPVVIDRYEWNHVATEDNSEDITTVAKALAVKPRTLEQLKARYYKVWAKSIEFANDGGKTMNDDEAKLHDSLLRYNPKQEETRKALTWQLAKRSAEEVREEEFLLSELQRIMISAQKFETERHEVRERLEMAQPIGNGTNAYTSASSSALNQLYAQLAAQDRNRKARHRLSLNVNDLGNATTPAPQTASTPVTAAPSTHRDSIGGSGQKRGPATAAQTPSRNLTSRQEARFGVTTHDRLQSGVGFRSDKLIKLRQAKSQIQTQKIAAALAELQVPEILVLPTARVCDVFESLIQRITKLVEARKVLEKEEGELRVAVNVRDEKAKAKGADAGEDEKKDDGSAEAEEQEVEGQETGNGDEKAEEDVEADADGGDDDADQEEEREDEDEDHLSEIDGENDGSALDAGVDADLDADADADAEIAVDGEGIEDDEALDVGDADGDANGDDDNDSQPAAAESEPARPSPARSHGPAASTRAGHKRSASIMSAASSKASRSSKRTRR